MDCSGRGNKEEQEYDETLWTNDPKQQEPGPIRKWVSSESKEDGWCHVKSFVADPSVYLDASQYKGDKVLNSDPGVPFINVFVELTDYFPWF